MKRKDKNRKIYEHYIDDVYNMVLFITNDEKITEKIIIDVFGEIYSDVKFFMNLEKKVHWIKKKAKEKIIEKMRKEKKFFYFNEYKKEIYMTKINFEKISKEQMKSVIRKLKVEERYVMFEVFYEGIKVEECAENLLVEVEVVKRMINKIQDRIDIERGKYNEEFDE